MSGATTVAVNPERLNKLLKHSRQQVNISMQPVRGDIVAFTDGSALINQQSFVSDLRFVQTHIKHFGAKCHFMAEG